MFYKNFVRNVFQHSTKFLIVLSLASFLGACASSDDDDEKAPAKKTDNVPAPMPAETITLEAALKKTVSMGDFATNPDMNELQAVTDAELSGCPAVDDAASFTVGELANEGALKLALGKISSGLSKCEAFINSSITTLIKDVTDATVEIGTETISEDGMAISYGGMVESTSNGALDVTQLGTDATASAHWLWKVSSDSTVSLVIYVASDSNAYAIGKQESAKGVFKIYCKNNKDLKPRCLQYRYADTSGDFDANTKHAGDTADVSTHGHYIGNLNAKHAYAFTSGTGTNMAYTLKSTDLQADLVDTDYQTYTYETLTTMATFVADVVNADRDDRKTALQTKQIKDQVTAIEKALDYSAKATDAEKLAKAYAKLKAAAAGAK